MRVFHLEPGLSFDFKNRKHHTAPGSFWRVISDLFKRTDSSESDMRNTSHAGRLFRFRHRRGRFLDNHGWFLCRVKRMKPFGLGGFEKLR